MPESPKLTPTWSIHSCPAVGFGFWDSQLVAVVVCCCGCGSSSSSFSSASTGQPKFNWIFNFFETNYFTLKKVVYISIYTLQSIRSLLSFYYHFWAGKRFLRGKKKQRRMSFTHIMRWPCVLLLLLWHDLEKFCTFALSPLALELTTCALSPYAHSRSLSRLPPTLLFYS